MNPGITKFVKLLQETGFRTVDSGDGETHDYGCDREFGYVSIQVDPEKLVSECHRLLELVTSLGICVEQVSPAKQPYIQGTYDPSTQVGIIDLCNIHDRML
jgi:hypothetical protein